MVFETLFALNSLLIMLGKYFSISTVIVVFGFLLPFVLATNPFCFIILLFLKFLIIIKMKVKSLIKLYKDGKISQEHFYKTLKIKISENLDEFLKELSHLESKENFFFIKEFFSIFFEAHFFSFPLVGETIEENLGIIVYLPKPTNIISNSKSENINFHIRQILNQNNVFVFFKENNFIGTSFSLALYLAYVLKKDISHILISVDMDKDRNLFPVEQEDEKELLAKKIKKPLLLKKHINSINDAITIVNQQKYTMEKLNEYKDFLHLENIQNKVLIIGDFLSGKTTKGLSIVKTKIDNGEIALFIDNNIHNVRDFENLNVFKVIDNATSIIDEKILRKFNVVITNKANLIKVLKDYYLIDLKLNINENIYEFIDKYVRKSIIEANVSIEILDKLIELSYYYRDFGIPKEKLIGFKIPKFLYEKDLKVFFTNEVIKSYFLARYFIEKKEDKNSFELDDLTKVLIIFHPEFERLSKEIRKKFISDVYSSIYFRRLNKKDVENFLKIAKKNNLNSIIVYEKAKDLYRYAKYEEALKIIEGYKYKNSKIQLLKANIFIDLWFLEEAIKILNNIKEYEEKKLGILINYFLKKGFFQEAKNIAKQKLSKFPDDFRNRSDYILTLSYLYRTKKDESIKKTLLIEFENSLKEFHSLRNLNRASEIDKQYLLRNFSYSLIEHPALYKENFKLSEKILNTPLYVYFMNVAYMNKDISTLEFLSKDEFMRNEPLENTIATLMLYLLTEDKDIKDKFLRKYKNIKKMFNKYIKSVYFSSHGKNTLKTSLLINNLPEIEENSNLQNLFSKIVYIQ